MSRFSVALSSALDSLGWSQADLCAETGIGASPMSRYVRGTADHVGPLVVERVTRALPAPHGASVLAAWLRDVVPGDLGALVAIEPLGGRVGEDEPAWPAVDPKMRALLLFFAQKSVAHPEVRDMLEALYAAFAARD